MTNGQQTDNAPQQQTAVSSPATKTSLGYKAYLLGLVLVIGTFVAYMPVMRAGFIWDDDAHVTENPNLRSFRGLYRIWFEPLANQQYYPLQLTGYWIEYHLWGLRPFGYHAANVLLHALSAVLLWTVLRELDIRGAWLAAAVFAVHPVEVESVAWISELKNLLSTTFYLGAMLAFFRFRPMSGEPQADSPPWRFYFMATALFLCALLSKTVACSLPAVLALLLWWKRGRLERRDIEVLSPMFLLGITLGLITAWLEKHHAGASGAEWSLSFLQRCLLAGRALWFYAGKLLWPHPLMFIYPHWDIDPAAWWQYLFPAATLAVLLVLWSLRSRIGRGPLVAALCFGCALFPSLGFFNVYPFRYSYVADHFQYLASIGIIVLAANGIARVLGHSRSWSAPAGNAVCSALLLTLGTLTWKQTRVYHNNETLWRDTVTKNPDAWIAQNNLGILLGNQGRSAEAIARYTEALRLKPDYAEAHNNLGFALSQMGKTDEAIQQYAEALRSDPDDVGARNNLGNALMQMGMLNEASKQYEAALRTKPDYADAHNNFGTLLLRMGRIPEAIQQWEEALQIQPDYPEAHNNLGVALARLGRQTAAMKHWEQAIRINPEYADAHCNLGIALQQAGKVQEAIEQYEQALRIKPDFVQARNALDQARAVQ
jgi:protein O-mannosyl-transferase